MRAFWVILSLVLALLPLSLLFRRAGSWRDGLRKSALQVLVEVAPRKYRLVIAFLYLGLVIFTAGKLKGLF